MTRTYDRIGVQIPQVYLPRPGTDLTRWAVIACDQFTSEPEYWQQVEQVVGEAPSTLNLVLPEVYLEKPGEHERIRRIQGNMVDYLKQGILQLREGMIYVERTTDGRTRRGLMLCLDLEQYDFNKGSHSLIRATEGTIIERLPPRMKIREGAILELPHILVLIDDPQMTVIEPVAALKGRLPEAYHFDLMLDSGTLAGYWIEDLQIEAQVVKALEALADPQYFSQKYGVGADQSVLLFAMGDGNHSLATAKAIWEKMKAQVGPEHPARYALVEIENVHDDGLTFEPIHRVIFNVKRDLLNEMRAYFGDNFDCTACASMEEMVKTVDHAAGRRHAVGVVSAQGFGVVWIANPTSNLPVGTLQGFLDGFMKAGKAEKIDYVHGEEVVARLGRQPGNVGFYLPGMSKGELFKTVILDGALPRKTFSMGEAREKRFYMEGRKIA